MAKILLAEDEEMNRDMLSRMLERRSCIVFMGAFGDWGVRDDCDSQPLDFARFPGKNESHLGRPGVS